MCFMVAWSHLYRPESTHSVAQIFGASPTDAALVHRHAYVQTCKDAGFCRRNRGVSVKAYRIEPSSVKVAGSSVSGLLVNDQAPGGSKSFAWSLVAHAGGFARLHVDEEPSVGRYQINDLLEASALAAQVKWAQLGGDNKGSSFSSGRLSVSITYQPFRMAFSVDGKLAVTLNSRDMFQFEHRRSKEVRGRAVSLPRSCAPCVASLDAAETAGQGHIQHACNQACTCPAYLVMPGRVL